MALVTVKDFSPEVLAEINRKIPLALQLVGEAAEGYAKEDCPVDTGRLRNSITYKVVDADCYIGTNVEYAIYVEFIDRYRHISGKAHFLRDAATTHGTEYRDIVKTVMKS